LTFKGLGEVCKGNQHIQQYVRNVSYQVDILAKLAQYTHIAERRR